MSGKHKILIIDDELQIRRMLKLSFEANNYSVLLAESGNDGLAQASVALPDIIILDLGLPDMDGTEVLHVLREWTKVPIIILSVRNAEEVIINCIDAGADDYMVKPFRMGELLVRVRLALRHIQLPQHEPLYTFGDLVVDLAARRVEVEGRRIKLSATEYSLLSLFVQNPDRVLTHNYILQKIWGPGFEGKAEYVRVYIAQLRKLIEKDPSIPQHIVTESRVGYRFKTD